MYRSSCPELFFKKGVLKNFAKFKRKHLKNPFFYRTPTVAVFEYIQVAIISRNPDMATIFDAGTDGSFIKTEHTFNQKKTI